MSNIVVTFVAQRLGATETAVRLLLSLFSGYPLAMLYRSSLMYYQPAFIKHIYFILTGLVLGYFNFGMEVYHTLINISIMYVVLKLAGGTKFSVAFAFIFNTMYLVIGYYFEVVSGREYNISWTMPQCVLTLRLTAVAFDLYDGHKNPVPPEAQESAITQSPSFLELFGQCYFFGGFLVGPQYCMRRYLNFVNGEYSDPRTKGPPNSQQPALERFLLGIAYIGGFQVVYLFFSDEYLQSSLFQERGLLFKCIVLLIWGKTCLNKYIGSWLLTEGAIIYCGLSHNNVDNNNVPLWDACTNVRVKSLETGCTLQEYIRSFNCNTNLWMAKYIFKRLRFLGNKLLSQFVTLFYLAIWHGLDSGYYVCFFLEFIYIFSERKLLCVVRPKADIVFLLASASIGITVERIEPLRKVAESPGLQPVIYVVKKIFSSFLLSYALVSFSLLQSRKWYSVYASVCAIGFIIPVVSLLACWVLRQLFPSKSAQNGVPSASQDDSRERRKAD